MSAVAVIAASYLLGSVPFSGLIARRLKGVDLRQVGTGTVSGTGLYRVAGLGPLIVGGILDLAKGSVGPLLAGESRPGLAIAAGAAAVVGHNWSLFLRGAGGRGISPAMGAMLPLAPEGSLLLLVALAVGKAADATSLGAFAGFVGLFPLLSRTRSLGTLLAAALVAPMLVKRVLGNQPPSGPDKLRVYLVRLFFDQDTPRWPRWFRQGKEP
ncbi:MAG: glycerol-3-phosphate acyltransferase [Acidimicrobiia bacterium]